MDESQKDHIVMTPKCKTANSTTLAIERRSIPIEESNNAKVHVAGGDHRGIIINKELAKDLDESPSQLSLEFRVFLVSTQTGKHTQESRCLDFWFTNTLSTQDQPSVAQEFFRELVSPQEFPRDYVGFIKKVMKLLQHGFNGIRKVEVTLKQLETTEQPPTRPSQQGALLISLQTRKPSVSADENSLGVVAPLTEERVLELIESSYPNPVTVTELAKCNGWQEEDVQIHLSQLQNKGLAKPLEHGAFTRAVAEEVQVVKQMPTMISAKQPTIAIITAQYCEKLAVDAMLENKETFVRYTTVGESNVYTLGNIGAHRVVSTKLPTVGHTREAMTAAGNTTTRMLGTFQKVDYVFLVGVGGGVPHYTDYRKHVRLGDVVASHPVNGHRCVYFYCENTKVSETGTEFETKEYCPHNMRLQEIAAQLQSQADTNSEIQWIQYLREGIQTLKNETEQDFSQPPAESDKLYMAIGERDLIEVAHPLPKEGGDSYRQEGCPRLHLAPIASGRAISRDDSLRQLFAQQTGALAFDSEFDSVLESVLGNCRDSFICLRGVADYRDGSRQKEWQPYAALAAAAVMKAVVIKMEPPTE